MDPQDLTFMTIHNLSPDANILFASESILDILGYQPEEVLGKSCFDYFHPDEVPLARSVHSRGVLLDKAAVLHYARIRSRDGRWVSCECCFTIVHDVLVASTSIYSGGAKSEGRAITAPQVRRLFSSSPLDPRYHMLEHLSPKFKMKPTEREPRAALVLNRFTRNLSIMFATNAVAAILGLRPDELLDRPFYHCIQENCLANAIACLESAKKNESIAYLRFWFRDPRQDDPAHGAGETDEDRDTTEDEDEDDEDDSDLSSQEDGETDLDADISSAVGDRGSWPAETCMDVDDRPPSRSRTRRNLSSRGHPNARQHAPLTPPSSSGAGSPHSSLGDSEGGLELEAVVSCTSDGLVVVLRKARPPIPDPQLPLVPAYNYENGLFAAPWSLHPIEPYYPPELLYKFRAPFLPEFMPVQEHIVAAGGPPRDQLLRSIRDVAVFAWALVGINGNLADYGRGLPRNGAQPPGGLPVWDPAVGPTAYRGPKPQIDENEPTRPIQPAYTGASGVMSRIQAGEQFNQLYNNHQHSTSTTVHPGGPYVPSMYGQGQHHQLSSADSTSQPRYHQACSPPNQSPAVAVPGCRCLAHEPCKQGAPCQAQDPSCASSPMRAPSPPKESYSRDMWK
ncbi:hypothetical protein B0H67DRAFT_487553 [Lasiosphaeris hirsuta]|uniref:PAS domain-containing protein n=1 Tax=Lasiosphaeris hirsuta TaxID=260670 RepID=A0AA40AEW7_9PEZI|nr:hypothetical protein B0H67DRAFT_487553 [Lasiosphaeris hirsuta]